MEELIKKRLTLKSYLTDSEASSLAVIMINAAKGGDSEAMHAVNESINVLGYQLAKVAYFIGLHGNNFSVSHIGSVIRNPFIMNKVSKTLKEYEPNAVIVNPKMEPWNAGSEIARRNIQFY